MVYYYILKQEHRIKGHNMPIASERTLKINVENSKCPMQISNSSCWTWGESLYQVEELICILTGSACLGKNVKPTREWLDVGSDLKFLLIYFVYTSLACHKSGFIIVNATVNTETSNPIMHMQHTFSHDNSNKIEWVSVDVDEVMVRGCNHWRYIFWWSSLKTDACRTCTSETINLTKMDYNACTLYHQTCLPQSLTGIEQPHWNRTGGLFTEEVHQVSR